jgi:hypothetical protein
MVKRGNDWSNVEEVGEGEEGLRAKHLGQAQEHPACGFGFQVYFSS